jgi:hypothetical protein
MPPKTNVAGTQNRTPKMKEEIKSIILEEELGIGDVMCLEAASGVVTH